MKAEQYSTREVELAGWKARVTSYKSGDTYYCSVDNVSPGAVVARAEGKTREEAEQAAVEKAAKYFAQTRKFSA
jgi:dsRNA-specific ribonuclease